MSKTGRVTSALYHWSARTPNAVALESETGSLTWRQLHHVVRSWAARFRADGLRPGQRMGYLTSNANETIAFILAVLAADCVVVPINVRLAPNEIADLAVDAGLSAVIVDAKHWEQLGPTRSALPDLKAYWQGDAAAAGAAALVIDPRDDAALSALPWEEVYGDDGLAVLSYTSGTTGRPKAAMLTHRNIMTAAKAFSLADDMSRHDSTLLVLPLAFTGSIIATWAPAYLSGGRTILHGRYSADATLAALESGRVTIFYAVPVVFEEVSALERFASADLSAVRVIRAGGAPSTPATLRPYHDRGIGLTVGWGQTESTGVGTCLQSGDVGRKSGSAGTPMLGIDVRVADENGFECPIGATGEVLLRGESVMAGYWKADDITAATIVDGWLHTGDLGRLDADGYLTLAGRSKDMLLSGGINVYPAEIERVLSDVPGVIEVAVVGRPDPKWGEVPVAFLVCEPGATDIQALTNACKRELADYKRPKAFIIRQDPLPRTMSGKIIKSGLRALAADGELEPPQGTVSR
jgi:fatty-acyl-CoA synthase